MNDNKSGLMSSTGPKQTTTVLDEMRKLLAPQSGPPETLEERLAGMTEPQRRTVLQTARLVQMAMRTKLAVGDQTEGYYDLVRSMYRNLPHNIATLVAEVLDETDPLNFTPQPKTVKRSRSDISAQVYSEYASAFGMDLEGPKQTAPQQQASPPQTQPKGAAAKPQTYQSKEEFLAALTPVAKEVALELGVSHKIVLAQAALESGWGKSVKGNNLMGIKSHGEAGGLDVVTHEVVNGKKVKITDKFRQYASPEDSIRGYGSFLKANSRYKHFLQAGAENEDAQLSALQSSGYATDPKYAYKLKSIINSLPDEEDEI
ncbi:glycoside hydrolase family 73 protein [Nereida ignava]|uniref:glycoside hydrolase family 73 protein n=1 Tax=Nereida ignava TaxID=282199 RepID=UPI002FE17931